MANIRRLCDPCPEGSRSSCFFLRLHRPHTVPRMWSLSVCPACFRFVSIGGMCGIAQMESATATLACVVLAFTLGDQCAVDKPPSVDEVRPKVVIHGQQFFVPEHYPQNASGRLQYVKKLFEQLDMKTTGVLRNMRKHNPPPAQPTYNDKKADLIYKRVFCDFTPMCTPLYIHIWYMRALPPPPWESGGPPRWGPKAPNMQEYAHFTPNATPFTHIALLVTRRPWELWSVVCRHCVPHVDTICSTRFATVDTTGML